MANKNLRLYLVATLLIGIASASFADTIVISTNIYAVAKKLGLQELSLVAMNWTNNPTEALHTIDWGEVAEAASWTRPNHFIKVNVKANLATWLVDIYTDNKELKTSEVSGAAQRAGLIEATYYSKGANSNVIESSNCAKVVLGWAVTASTNSVASGNYVAGTPGDLGSGWVNVWGSTTTSPVKVSWAYMKDKGDKDDPEIPGNQSWDTPIIEGGKTVPGAHSGGYTVIAYGGPDYKNLNNGLSVNQLDPIYILLEGGFGSAPGNKEYKGDIRFDLYYK